MVNEEEESGPAAAIYPASALVAIGPTGPDAKPCQASGAGLRACNSIFPLRSEIGVENLL